MTLPERRDPTAAEVRAAAPRSDGRSPHGRDLPDFRNLGVLLRTLLGVNLMAAAVAAVPATGVAGWGDDFLSLAFRVEPPLLASVVLLVASARLLRRLPWPFGHVSVIVGVGAVVVLFEDAWRYMGLVPRDGFGLARALFFAGGAAVVLLGYFSLRARAASPAVTEARLAALTARIRPHFLFNSLNAVLSLIRSDPRRAEAALESLAELFRVLMRDPRDLTPLSEEIALCRQYLDLERLRLGERLQVEWQVEAVPDDALVPPLMLQPLLENAVYHGIEPADGGGRLKIVFARQGDGLLIELTNPVGDRAPHAVGNHMALANIRERLALHYDLEARLETGEAEGRYRVTISLPYRRQD